MPKTLNSPKGSSFDLLQDKDIDRWYQNVKRGSKKTADVYLRRLKCFSDHVGISIKDLPKMPEVQIYNTMLDFVTTEEKRGLAGSTIHSSLKAVKNWLVFNNVHIRNKITIKDPQRTPTIEDERVPTVEELHRVFMNTTPQGRVCCVLMAHAGLRPNVIGDSHDGLMIKDFPELHIENGKVIFEKIPTKVRVRANLSKAGHEYFTFLSEEGCGYLRDYLEIRLRNGEKLEPESDVIHPEKTNKKFICTVNISSIIKKSLLKAGVKSRPYVLRAFFSTQMVLAESKGTMISIYRKFLFGHKGDMEARYSTNKGRLPEDMIEDMREKYRLSQEFLQTTQKEKIDEKLQAEIQRIMFDLNNINHDEFWGSLKKVFSESVDLAGNTDFGNHGRHVGGNNAAIVANSANGSRHRIVSPENADTLLQQGYKFVQELRGGNLILEAPY